MISLRQEMREKHVSEQIVRWITVLARELHLRSEPKDKDVVDVAHIIHLGQLLSDLCFWNIGSTRMQYINDLHKSNCMGQ